ncbi:hypothetical protein [Pseudoxanthomonas mexicana]
MIFRDKYEHGARVVATRTSATFFAKGDTGVVIGSARDGNYHVRFDNGAMWWLNELEFTREHARRRRCSIFERLAIRWAWLRGRGA